MSDPAFWHKHKLDAHSRRDKAVAARAEELEKYNLEHLTMADITAIMDDLPQWQQDAICEAVRNKLDYDFGRIVGTLVRKELARLADRQADAETPEAEEFEK